MCYRFDLNEDGYEIIASPYNACHWYQERKEEGKTRTGKQKENARRKKRETRKAKKKEKEKLGK